MRVHDLEEKVKTEIVLPQKYIIGFHKEIIFFLSILHIFWLCLAAYRNPVKSFKVIRELIKRRKQINGGRRIARYFKSKGRYYWSLYTPGWPSESFRNFILDEFDRISPFKKKKPALLTAIFSITSKCELRCKHCFEWEKLSKEEILSFDDLNKIIELLKSRDITQIQLSGGEPLNRFDDMLELIQPDSDQIDFWMLTSGYKLSFEKAKMLKSAGLTGVNVSLDHWDEKKHNEFRNKQNSFYWVHEAINNSEKAGLLTALSLCATREFISETNLRIYYDLTHRMGVSFVQILEPRQAGRFAGKDVLLKKSHIDILTKFYLEALSYQGFRDYPTLSYPGYHQRMLGCFGAGNRYLFIDAKGNIHACPFCQEAAGSILNGSFEESLDKLKSRGCHKFETNIAG